MTNAPARPQSPVLGTAIVGILVLVAALLFAAVYLFLPGNQHFYGLLTIGILSLVFALGCYLAQSIAPNPVVPRALSWGFAGLGFALLFGTVAINPGSTLSSLGQILTLVVVLLFLAVTLVGAYWRTWTVASARTRVERREAFQSQPPRSALEYAAAQHDRDVTQPSTATSKGPP
ncbi:MAG: hypothetical protein L3J81_04270 [Thermoplasmata archaeon]|jgi:peptidoglycan/LPS O-acetylase OafA/YrhL|nr:hypothetical protein [Thermoplasmata archaeon]